MFDIVGVNPTAPTTARTDSLTKHIFFKAIDFWGGEVGLRERQTRDLIKDKWAHENSKRLYRIRYDEDVIRRLEVMLSSTNA